MHAPFEVEHERVDKTYVVSVHGSIDLTTGAAVSDALHAAHESQIGTVIVDLRDTDFMDSTGLHILLDGQRDLIREKRRLAIVCPDGKVRRILELIQLSGTFELHQSVEDVLADRAGSP